MSPPSPLPLPLPLSPPLPLSRVKLTQYIHDVTVLFPNMKQDGVSLQPPGSICIIMIQRRLVTDSN